MSGDSLQDWRRERLGELARLKGGKAALGRLLGYSDGAFVGQMLAGLRPVTEKTVDAAEKLPGAKGWFSREQSAAKGLVYEELSEEEKVFLDDFRFILDSDRERITLEVAQRAAELRVHMEKHSKPGIPLVAKPRQAAAARGAGAKTAAEPRRPDPNQNVLPLETEGRK